MSISKITITLIIFVVILWIASILIIPIYFGKPDSPAAFGDMFGCISALFSGLAFVGVIIAILLQRQELQLQRQDLELTRNELEGQKIQLQQQNKTFRKQAFENMLFQLLKLHMDIIAAIDLTITGRYGPNLNQGRNCFITFYQGIREKYSQSKHTEIDKRIQFAIKEFNHQTSYHLSHYFKNLNRIFEFIDNSDIENKNIYIKIAKSILSDQELIILFYYTIGNLLDLEFLKLLIKNNIFDELPKDRLIEPSHLSLIEKVKTT